MKQRAKSFESRSLAIQMPRSRGHGWPLILWTRAIRYSFVWDFETAITPFRGEFAVFEAIFLRLDLMIQGCRLAPEVAPEMALSTHLTGWPASTIPDFIH